MDTIWFALLLTGVLGVVVLIEKIKELRKAHKAKQKTQASETVDGTDWQWYDNKANVKKHRKQTRRELHESMKGKEGR